MSFVRPTHTRTVLLFVSLDSHCQPAAAEGYTDLEGKPKAFQRWPLGWLCQQVRALDSCCFGQFSLVFFLIQSQIIRTNYVGLTSWTGQLVFLVAGRYVSVVMCGIADEHRTVSSPWTQSIP